MAKQVARLSPRASARERRAQWHASKNEPRSASNQLSVASAATINLNYTRSDTRILITGTTTITTIHLAKNEKRELEFAGALQIAYNASKIETPANENITTVAGDIVAVEGIDGTIVRLTRYERQAQSVDAVADLQTDVAALQAQASPTLVVLTSAVEIDNTSMENVTGLSFAVAANTNYVLEAVLRIETGDFMDFEFSGPSSPTGVFIAIDQDGGQPAIVTAFSAATTFAGSSLVDFVVHIHGIIRNGANAGTVQLRAAMTTGGPQDVMVNSWMVVTEF